jgi:hypothetical protein
MHRSHPAAQKTVDTLIQHLSPVSNSTVAVFATSSENEPLVLSSYAHFPKTKKAKAEESRLPLVKSYLDQLECPAGLSDKEMATFLCYSMCFFLRND